MATTLLYNAEIVNEGRRFRGYVLVDGRKISRVGELPAGEEVPAALKEGVARAIDCGGRLLMPGVIDTHVHFRDPGLTEKGDMATESRAAVAGGVTSFVDMPNTKPATVSREALEAKISRAAEVSAANYGFFIGATNDNAQELKETDYHRAAGIKLFLGSSTGNMLVDDNNTLEELFAAAKAPIAVHAEDEATIRAARARLEEECGGSIPVGRHPDVRPREACVKATRKAIELARRTGARVHICHLSTAEELQLVKEAKAEGVRVTAETCPQYLLFDRNDFLRSGSRIKCNPAIKEASDRIALLRELLPGGCIDTIATDHAPHLPAQKEGDALTAASGMPMVQFSLRAMLELFESAPGLEEAGPERVVELMCHRPADLFGIEGRGYIREGYYADLVVVDPEAGAPKVTDAEVLSRCGWTPLAGMSLPARVELTMVNGTVVYEAGGEPEGGAAMPITFGAFRPD
ncbi:MAG: dihydroorotase [Duncaniella sp.]|uniref:dihydroorotase n=1 Tax=Duncaniella sp. TaxID=2518496 RepID=UPI0023C47D03|nr:dihydroorotase [Duncaniella sp.]MDE5988705.1 dihydroorotase [Duncaniella sp.]